MKIHFLLPTIFSLSFVIVCHHAFADGSEQKYP